MGAKDTGKENRMGKGFEPYHTKPEDRLLDGAWQEHKGLNLHLGGQGQIPRAEVQEWGRDHCSLELQVHVGVLSG